MNQVEKKFKLSKETVIFLFVAVIVLVTVVILNNNGVEVEIGEFESNELANASYVMAGMITLYESVVDVNHETPGQILAQTHSEEFVNYLDDFNYLLKTSELYFEGNDMFDEHTLKEFEEGEYDYKVAYTINGQLYEFYFLQYKVMLEGKLVFNNKEYLFEGSLEESDGEIGIDLHVQFGSGNFVIVSYHNYIGAAEDRGYHTEIRLNNVGTYRDFYIHETPSGVELAIIGAYDEYLVREVTSLEGYIYEVEYRIDNIEGSVEISLNQEDYDVDVFEYIIHEDGETSDVIVYVPLDN